MNKINYDFSAFIETFNKMKASCAVTPDDLNCLKTEFNRFFDDCDCKEVIFTNNTDKMFFGVKILPVIDADDIYDYLVGDEPIRIEKYIVEIDSHLLDPIMDLSAHELMAIIIHEVWHIVEDSSPIEKARNAMNAYLAGNKDYIRISKSIHYKEILAYGLKDYLSKNHSIFYDRDANEIHADEFASYYGFCEHLISAFNKIYNNNIKLYENCEISKFIVFSWTLNLYKNLKTRRIGAIKTLTRAKQLTGSRLERLEMDNVIRRIKRIDDDAIMEASTTIDNIRLKIREKMKKARLNNLRTIDSTFYELSMQVRNVEDENDALYLMRQINSSLAIIDEYRNSADCDEYEAAKWNQVMDKFLELREKLTSTVVYKNKNYGLFVNYPDIVENRY